MCDSPVLAAEAPRGASAFLYPRERRGMNYDIFGDVHGHRAELELLLDKLGYEPDSWEGWLPPEGTTAVFLGDFIDRGPDSRGVIRIVRRMMDTGRAVAVLGNHEYNAICWWTERPGAGPLREHGEKNRRQHASFLRQYEDDPVGWEDVIAWFRTLPMYLELEDGPRVVHACWDEETIRAARSHAHLRDGRLTRTFLFDSVPDPKLPLLVTPEFRIVETLIKGPEEETGSQRDDVDGNVRTTRRIPWWERYPKDAPPVVFGHYWWTPDDGPHLGRNWLCLDLSVAKGGRLACYRWRPGRRRMRFSDRNLVSVPAIPPAERRDTAPEAPFPGA